MPLGALLFGAAPLACSPAPTPSMPLASTGGSEDSTSTTTPGLTSEQTSSGEGDTTGVGSSGGEPEDVPPAELEPGELRPGGETTTDELGVGAFLQRAANLSLGNGGAFEAGLQFFQLVWEVAPSTPELDGLGPTFNARSCLECHIRNGRGPTAIEDPATPAVLIRLADASGAADPALGAQLQPLSIPGVPGEGSVTWAEQAFDEIEVDGGVIERVLLIPTVTPRALGAPSRGTLASARVSMQLVGQGLLEAIDPSSIEALADPDDDDGDGISGRTASLRGGALGRFGWKAGQPTVRHQTAAAFLGDLGITSELGPTNNCPPVQAECAAAPTGGEPELTETRLDVTAAYVRLLGVPARRDGDDIEVRRGKTLFHQLGCASCHHPSFVTGMAAESELESQTIWPYTDLLLHDMGSELAQGGPEGDAAASEWRTPPLWSLGLLETVGGSRRLLHDGRARSLEEAIAWHGGEAAASRDAYLELPALNRARLHAFIDSL
ncbi:MAG: di-heme oxidoredictase family protein [Myxococcota bacterium]